MGARSARPTAASAARARRCRSAVFNGLRSVEQRQLDVVERRGSRQEIESLKDEPDLSCCGRPRGRSVEAAPRPARRARYWPDVGRSRQPRMCMNVDLPEPDGPVSATNSPASMSSDTRGAHAPDLAERVGLHEIAKRDDGTDQPRAAPAAGKPPTARPAAGIGSRGSRADRRRAEAWPSR